MAVPRWARWPLAYAATLAGAAVAGALTPLGPGNAVFVAGALCVFASAAFIRLGGPQTLVGRSLKGAPQWGLDPEKRRVELARGWRLFLMGLALWAVLAAAWLIRRGA